VSTIELRTARSGGAGRLPAHADVVVVGAGFSGLAMARELRRRGHRDFLVLERADDVGGVWRDNTYPGCACDVPSHLYSFSFALNPEWSSTYSPQPEIHAYLKRTAEQEGLLDRVRFGCELTDARWDPEAAQWRLETTRGVLTARALVVAPGGLVEPKLPDIPGLADFPGTVFHSARWNHEHRLDGERVAVVGTGASAIQFVPRIQPRVGKLVLFQRTAPWILPRTDRPITRLERAVFRRVPGAQRLMRTLVFWLREAGALTMLRPALSVLSRTSGLAHLRRQVPDRELRRKLTPRYAPGCKRILLSNDYLPSLTRPNVEVLTEGLAEVRGSTVVGTDGSEREVDTIILGTGFEVTEPPIAERIRDGAGRSLADHWDGSMRAHKGTTVAGFPNLYFLTGPNTGLGHTSVVLMAEAQVRYVAQALRHEVVEVRPEAEAAWNELVQRKTRGTVWVSGGCASWYLDRRGLNTTLWPDFQHRFTLALRRFEPSEHRIASVPAQARGKAAA
jgi:cation diffusion facilitator CzcD-associated flavoprotein CzcO